MAANTNTVQLVVVGLCLGMPRLGWVKPSAGERLTDHVSLGVVTRVFPGAIVDQVIEQCGVGELRSRLLPARATMYFVLGLALFSTDSYDEVIRQVTSGLQWGSGWSQPWHLPSKSALSQARQRLGPQVVTRLFESVAKPLLVGEKVGGLIPVAVDGTVVDVPDEPGNVGEFGRPAAKQGAKAAYPQIRVVAMAECATHAMFAVALSGLADGEQTLLPRLYTRLHPGLLLLADRGFFSYDLWRQGLATGAQLCWRMKKNTVLPVVEELDDGSYVSAIYPDPSSRRRRADAIAVRVVEYEVDGSLFRLATSLMDPGVASAEALAQAYHQRWEIESSFDELKTHQGRPSLVLRSRCPDLVRQEVMAFLCVHYAIRWLMAQATSDTGVDPGRASFVATLRSARRTIATQPGFSPHRPS